VKSPDGVDYVPVRSRWFINGDLQKRT
jgi:hypothetical protein